MDAGKSGRLAPPIGGARTRGRSPTGACKALLAGVALLGAAMPVAAGVLYKSIAANGVIQFSDTPPENAAVVEVRPFPDPTRPADENAISGTIPASPALVAVDPDALARANEALDLAEHAFALARRSLWSPGDGLHLARKPPTAADIARAEFYRRDVVAARQNLVAVLQGQADDPRAARRAAGAVRVSSR